MISSMKLLSRCNISLETPESKFALISEQIMKSQCRVQVAFVIKAHLAKKQGDLDHVQWPSNPAVLTGTASSEGNQRLKK